jgi:hypothetical protein
LDTGGAEWAGPSPPMLLRHVTFVLLAGCTSAAALPSYDGVKLNGTGPTAVGARNRILVDNTCRPEVMPRDCDWHGGIYIREVVVDDPTLVSFEVASGPGPIIFRAMRPGRTHLRVDVARPDGKVQSAEGTLETGTATTIEVRPDCVDARQPEPVLAPAGRELRIMMRLMGTGPDADPSAPTGLSGDDFVPFDLGALMLKKPPQRLSELLDGTLMGHDQILLVAQLPEASTRITTPLDPAFGRTFRSYRPTDVDGLRLTTSRTRLPLGAATHLAIHGTVTGTEPCVPPEVIRPRTAATNTPDVCTLLAGTSMGPTVPVTTEVVARGLARGTCRVSVRHDDGGGEGMAELVFE